jgi:SAM-dependent methyltransferase
MERIKMREENIHRLNSHEIPLNNINFLVYKFYHADLFDTLKKYAKGKLLDIGCGNKPYLDIIDPIVNEYIGCDIVQSSDNKADILCDATKIPLPGASFDTIISTQTIEHIAEPQYLINESYRLLKNGGYLVISGPMYWPLHEEPYDFFRFTKHGFRYLLKNAGYTVIEERTNGGKWALCGQVFLHALYPDLYIQKGMKWKAVRSILKLLGGIQFINKLFVSLNEKYPDETNTMNYVFVAKK